MTSGGVWFYHHQEAEFFERVGGDVLRPKVRSATDHFIPEAESATIVARGVFDRFTARHQDFRFKEASDNPLNPANRADTFEIELLRKLRADPSIKQLTTFTGEASGRSDDTPAQEWFVAAKPIVADASCLRCHDSPATAPPEIVARYGTQHGYGWKEGDVVAA